MMTLPMELKHCERCQSVASICNYKLYFVLGNHQKNANILMKIEFWYPAPDAVQYLCIVLNKTLCKTRKSALLQEPQQPRRQKRSEIIEFFKLTKQTQNLIIFIKNCIDFARTYVFTCPLQISTS